MTAPRYPWVAQVDGDFDADDSLTQLKARTLNHNLDHVQDALYDRIVHIPARLHDHDGVNSALIQFPSPNLIERASINTTTFAGEWVKSGAGVTIGSESAGGAELQVAGEYIYTPLSTSDLDTEDCIGAGARFTVSVFAKLGGAPGLSSPGIVHFGLSDASSSAFMTGCRGTFRETLLTTTYKRFWFSCLTPDVSTECWFLTRVGTDSTVAMYVDCVSVTLGPRLGWWQPADCDPKHYRFKAISRDCPAWDYNIGMVNAHRVTEIA